MPRKGTAPGPLVVDPGVRVALGDPAGQQGCWCAGKRSTAQAHRLRAWRAAANKTGTDPVVTLKRALDNVKPTLEVKSRRVGRRDIQVPVEVKNPTQTRTLALRWR